MLSLTRDRKLNPERPVPAEPDVSDEVRTNANSQLGKIERRTSKHFDVLVRGRAIEDRGDVYLT